MAAPGACCLPDGSCVDVTSELECIGTFSGFFQGPGTLCANVDCTGPGACCLPTGACIDITGGAVECAGLNGTFIALVSCSTNPCPTALPEACCFRDGTCQDIIAVTCISQGGVPQGFGLACAAVTCGDCCFTDGSCIVTGVLSCINAGGNPGVGGVTPCDPNPCPQNNPEACCFSDGTCQDLNPPICIFLGGIPAGGGSNCATFNCGTIQACCLPDGSCVDATDIFCDNMGGIPQGPGTACANTECPEACCFVDGTCQDLTPTDCVNTMVAGGPGTPQGPGTNCTSVVCPLPPVCCCFENSTTECLSPTDCINAGGTPLGPGSCVFNGSEFQCTSSGFFIVCCLPDASGTCVETSEECCIALGGAQDTLGAPSCDGDPCPATCCLPDGTCDRIPAFQCFDNGGTIDPNNPLCLSEACCLPDGSCIETTDTCCISAGGSPQGAVSCTAINNCNVPGACCLGDGNCVDVNNSLECEALGLSFPGSFIVGVNCASNPCPGLEACCFPDGSCMDYLAGFCAANGGDPQGGGTNCATTTCPIVLGGCCFDLNGEFICTLRTEQECMNSAGTFYGVGVPCPTPTIVCPTDIVVSTDVGLCTAIVGIPDPVVTDECDDQPTFMCTRSDALPLNDPYPLGTTTITCVGQNASGIQSQQCTFDVTVEDNEPPMIVSCAGDQSSAVDENCETTITDLTQLIVVNDNCPGPITITQDPPAGTVVTVGITPITITVEDAAGNISMCTADFMAIDITPPNLACSIFGTVNVELTDDCHFDPNLDVTDNCGVASVECTRSDGRDIDDGYSFGTTTLICTATDTSGNTDTCTYIINSTYIDTIPPIITCPADIVTNNDPGKCGAIVTYPDPIAIDDCDLDPTVKCVPPSGSFFIVGTTMVTCFAIDFTGNVSTCMFAIVVNDVEPPEISCPADITVPVDSGECQAVVTWDRPFTCDNCDCVEVECDPSSGSAFPIGTTIVTCTATDSSDNQAQCTFTVTVNDTEPPQIACPSDIVVDNDPGECGAVVFWDLPVASDTCSPVTVTCDPTPGTFFPIGISRVECVAVDIFGNRAACSFCIIVNNVEPIVISCPANIIQMVGSEITQLELIIPKPVVMSGSCSIISVTNDYNDTEDASDVYPLGTTVITWTATDIDGNGISCKQYIKLVSLDVTQFGDCHTLANPGNSLENRLNNMMMTLINRINDVINGNTVFNGSPIFESDILLSNNKIRGVAEPVCPVDAANKKYVDEQLDRKIEELRNELEKKFISILDPENT